MPASLLTTDQWQEVKRASEQGVDDETLSQEYGVSRESIRKRRSLEGWMSPERLHQAAEAERVRKANVATGSISRISQEGLKPRDSIGIVGKSLAEMGEKATLRRANFLEGILERVETGSTLPDPRNWKEYSSAVTLQRRELNLDKPQTNVQVFTLWDREGYAQSSRSESEKDEWD